MSDVTREAKLSGGVIEYRDAGAGPVVVLVHGARCSASWLPRTRAGSRDWWSASSSGTPDTVPCALGQLGRAPHEFQHDRAERLQLHVVTGPLEALLED